MFDNIIGQKYAISSLEQSVKDATMARAMLFYGPQYAGKLSTALELGRVLTCDTGKGDWSCSCASCRKQRLLVHPDILMLGTRDFDSEIAASGDVLLRIHKKSAQFLFIRACRKLSRRFDGLLWEGDDTKMRAFSPLVSELEELVDALSFKGEQTDYTHTEQSIKKIVELSVKLSSVLKSDNIPINQVRKATTWAHLSSGGSAKLIIIENADRMLESSRNSLLKLLEEPPRNVSIVLLSTRKDAIIKTILSRVRPYCFAERTKEEQKEILTRIFHEDTGEFGALREYFLAWKSMNPSLFATLSAKFIEHLSADKKLEPDIAEEMEELFATKADKTVFFTFAEELSFRLHEMILAPDCPAGRVSLVETWFTILRDTVSSVEQLNLGPKNVLVSLFYRMRSYV
jgi:DNA polymerase-3 subunit gamma/tau